MSDAKDPLVGRTLGGYRVQALLHRGAAGRIYRAKQLTVGRSVALKMPSPKLASDSGFVSLFLKETRRAASLNHANVVQIHDVCQEGKLVFYSMEYLPGGSLAAWVKRQGPIPWKTLANHLRDIGEALLFGEQNETTHCDVNPTHLLFTQDGRVKVINLGLGLGLRRSRDPNLKPPLASLPFMAPEQIVEGGADNRSDIYALGCTFFFAACGRLPFKGKTAKEIFSAKMLQDPPHLSQEVEDLPGWLSDLVGSMVVRDPDRRPQGFQEVVDVLHENVGRSKSARPAKVSAASRRPPEGESTGFLSTMAGKITVASAAVCLLILVIFLVSSPGGEDPDIAGTGGRRASAGPPAGGPDPGGSAGDRSPRTDSRDTRGAVSSESSESPGSEEPREMTLQEKRLLARKGLTSAGTDIAGDSISGESTPNSRGVVELERLAARWRINLPNLPHAMDALKKVKKEYPGPDVERRADEILATLLEQERARELDHFLTAELKPLLEAKDYGKAMKSLEDFGRKSPDNARAVREKREEVLGQAKADLEGLEPHIESLTNDGKFARAIELLRDLATRLPETLQAPARKRISELQSAKDGAAELDKVYAKAEQTLHRHLRGADFSGAEAYASKLPESAHPVFKARRERIVKEVRLCQDAWKTLLAGLERAKEEKTLRLEVYPLRRSPLKFAGRVKSYELGEGGEVTLDLDRSKGKGLSCNVFDLTDDVLFELMRNPDGAGADYPPPPLVEGLGLLLYHRQGPKRAWGTLAGHTKLSNDTRDAYSDRLREGGKYQLDELLAAAQDKTNALEADPDSISAKELDALCASLERAVANHRGFSYYRGVRKTLAESYRLAFEAKLRKEGIEDFIHGKVSGKLGGKVKITYDFSSEDQLEDFEVIEGNLKLEGRTLRVSGECRLLKGNPFKNTMSVTVDVPKGGYNQTAPNINIAVWTHEGDKVTWRYVLRTTSSTTTRATTSGVEDPNDYLVFSVGYHPRRGTSYYYSYLTMIDNGHVAPMPAYAILGGAHDKRLHSRYSSYYFGCIWGESILNKVKGQRQVMKLVLTPSTFKWSANNVSLHTKAFKKVPGLKSWLDVKDRSGSVSLFTNGTAVYYSKLVVDTELDPLWFEEQLKERSAGEFETMEKLYATLDG